MYSKVIIAFVGTIVLLTSCDKDATLRKTIENSLEQIRGQYKISSMQWLGEPAEIDLDGDGEASADLFAEFDKLAEYHFPGGDKQWGNIYYGISCIYTPIDVVDIASARQGSIDISLPLQYVESVHWAEDGYLISTVDRRQDIDIDYYIEDDGSYFFKEFEKIQNPVDENLLDLCALSNGTVMYIAPGELQLDITYLFYDYITRQTVTGPVRMRFKRYTMALPGE